MLEHKTFLQPVTNRPSAMFYVTKTSFQHRQDIVTTHLWNLVMNLRKRAKNSGLRADLSSEWCQNPLFL